MQGGVRVRRALTWPGPTARPGQLTMYHCLENQGSVGTTRERFTRLCSVCCWNHCTWWWVGGRGDHTVGGTGPMSSPPYSQLPVLTPGCFRGPCLLALLQIPGQEAKICFQGLGRPLPGSAGVGGRGVWGLRVRRLCVWAVTSLSHGGDIGWSQGPVFAGAALGGSRVPEALPWEDAEILRAPIPKGPPHMW